MRQRRRDIYISVVIALSFLCFLSLFIGFLSLPWTESNNMAEREFIMEAVFEENSGHSVPELRLLNSFDDSFYLRVQKTDLVVEAPEIIEEVAIVEQPAPIIQEAIVIPEPVVIVEPEPVIIPEPIVVVEEVIAIPEPIIIPAPVDEPIIQQTVEEDEDDFWADFFVQGDELILDAGYYYMSLYVNDDYFGETEVLIENGISYLSIPYLREYTEPLISEEAKQRIFSSDTEFMTAEELNILGVDVDIRESDWAVYVYFNTEDMPWKTISVAGLDNRTLFRPIAGAEVVEKANFSAISKISSNLNLTYLNRSTLNWNYNANVINTLSIYDWFLDFSFSLRSNKSKLISFSPGSWNLYREFEDEMIRLDIGHVQTKLLSPNGTAIGISFDKDFMYASLDAKRMSVHNEILEITTESRVIITNAGKEIYNRVLSPGNYRLEDFVLFTGINEINVQIEPLNGEPTREIYHEFSYASSLLAPSETKYGAALSFGRESLYSEKYVRDGALSFEIGGRIQQFDIRNLALSGYYNIGLTKSTTINTALAVANKPSSKYVFNPYAKLAIEVNTANPYGVFRTNANLSLQKEKKPQLYLRFGQQIPLDSRLFRTLNLSLTYNSPANGDRHSLALSASSAGNLINDINWNVGGNLTLYSDSLENSIYSLNLGLSAVPVSGVSVSLSANLNGTMNSAPTLNGRLYGTVSLGKAGNANLSIDQKSSKASYRVSVGDWNISSEISTAGLGERILLSDGKNYNISANASTTFDKATLATTFKTNLDMSNISASILSTSNLLYADGAFAITSTTPSRYLIVKQDPSIRDNDTSLLVPGYSKTEKLNKLFSNYLYDGLGQRGVSLELYSANTDNTLLGVVNKTITIEEGKKGAFVYNLIPDKVYQISGLLSYDGLTYSNDSSPIYRLVEGEDGSFTLELTQEYYLFSDASGRFVINDIQPGTYAFDSKDRNGNWNLCIFEVSEEECNITEMNLFAASEEARDGSELDYSRIIDFRFYDSVTEDEFWSITDAEWEEAI